MVILNTNLTKEDFKYFVSEMKTLMSARDGKRLPKTKAKQSQEMLLEKNVVPLAEAGQIEAMQKYCECLPSSAIMNSIIVSNFMKLEAKTIKEPRELLALSSYYNWYVQRYKASYDNIDIESLEEYRKAREYYRKAGQMLYQIGKTDPIARESAFLMQKRNREELTPEEYSRSMSNSRNQIFTTAIHQTNDNLRLKLMIRYCQNLVNYASDKEYALHQGRVEMVIASVRKRIIPDELNRS